jgi:hypothetical protein
MENNTKDKKFREFLNTDVIIMTEWAMWADGKPDSYRINYIEDVYKGLK